MAKRIRILVASALACLLVHPVVAAESRARLIIDLKLIGKEQWQNAKGTDQATVRTEQTLSYIAVVETDGEIVDFNMKDPNYAQQQMAKATGGAAPAQAGSGTYINYFGVPDCDGRIRVTMNDVTEGRFADVNGAVPFSVKTTADYTGDANERLIMCSQTNLVVDPKQATMYTDGLLVQGGKGKSVRAQLGQTTESQSELVLKAEALEWASAQLRKAPLAGTRKGTVRITSANSSSVPFSSQGSGTADVELTWKLEKM